MSDKNDKTIHVCNVCGGTNHDEDIFRVYKLEDNKVCELCLQTEIAPASPDMYMNFVNKGEMVYEDIDKEVSYIGKLEEEYYQAMQEAFSDNPDVIVEPIIKVKKAPVVIKPIELKDYLDKNAVGQNEAKRVLSIAVYNHFKRLRIQDDTGVQMKKNNILLSGSTGVGKTFITQLIAKKLGVPFVTADANSITQAGYVGGDVEDILENLYNTADKDIELAQRGIVLIDEIDKISAKQGRDGVNSRDPSGEGAQQALLKLIEGGVFKVEIGQGPRKTDLMFDTTNVLFIVAGAFSAIESIVHSREVGSDKSFLGGESVKLSKREIYQKIRFDDFERFGIIPELLGRLPVRVALRPLTENNLVDIMSEIDNNIVDQYKLLLDDDNVKLKVTKGALTQIARNAIVNNSGARGLQGIFEELLRDTMFNAPSDDSITDFSITRKSVIDFMSNKEK